MTRTGSRGPEGRRRAALSVSLIVGVALGFASGCGGDDAPARAPTGETGVLGLRQALPIGEAPDWYATRLQELGYETTSVEYDDSTHEYRLLRGDRRFRVRLVLDDEIERVARVRIEETAGAGTTADASGTAAGAGQASGGAPGPGAGAAAGTGDPSDPDTPASDEETLRRPAPPVPEAQPPRPRPRALATLPAGTRIPARLYDRLDSGSVEEAQGFTMAVARPVRAGREVAIPAGSVVHGVVAEVASAAGSDGRGRLRLRADSVEVESVSFELDGVIVAPDATVGESGGGTFLAPAGEEVTLPVDTLMAIVLRSDTTIEIY